MWWAHEEDLQDERVYQVVRTDALLWQRARDLGISRRRLLQLLTVGGASVVLAGVWPRRAQRALAASVSELVVKPTPPELFVDHGSNKERHWDERFSETVEEYLKGLWRFVPSWASRAGLHEYDGQVGERSREAIQEEIRHLHSFLRRLEAFASHLLDPNTRLDREFLLSRLRLALLELEEIRRWQKDPRFYSQEMDLSNLLLREATPLAERMKAIVCRLERFPALLSAAKANVTDPQAPFVQTAIRSFTGFAPFFLGELAATVKQVHSRALKARFQKVARQAAAVTEAYARYLKDKVLPQAANRYAIGAEIFARMLLYGEMVDTPLGELRAIAEAEKRRLQTKIAQAAAQLSPGLSPAEALEKISQDYPAPEQLTAVAQAQLSGLKAFLQEKDLVTMLDGDCVVREAPPFRRWNPAYLWPPGPFETVSTIGLYFIMPVEPTWSREEKEGYLRANNFYALHNTTAHETFPGHYLQSLHARRAPTKVQKLFSCYSLHEGWAHYGEEMILDEGFAEGDSRYRLEQLRDALMRVARFRCALGLHTEGWSVAQAEEYFKKEAYQDPVNARLQAVRGTFDPGYLNYTLGKLMILKLREDFRQEQGGAFRLKQFHDALLAHGTLPVPLLRKMLLRADDGVLFLRNPG